MSSKGTTRKRRCLEDAKSGKQHPQQHASLPPPPGRESLLSSIFGNDSAAAAAAPKDEKDAAAGVPLFSNATKWKSTFDDLLQKNLAKQQQQKEKATTGTTATTSVSREDILKKRRAWNASEQSKNLVETITVNVQDYVGSSSTEANNKEEDDADIENDENNGELRLFSKKCASVVRNQGVLIIRSNAEKGRADDDTVCSLFPFDLLHRVAKRATDMERKVCKRLEEVGQMKWRQAEQEEEDASFCYLEVASRCQGRLDVRYQTNQSPIVDLVLQNRFLWSIMKELLGTDAKLVYTGLIYSFGNSSDQPWHQDGTALFHMDELDVDLPPYALNVFVPLSDITEQLGPTEFLVGSHFLDRTRQVQEHLQKQGDLTTDETLIGPLLKFGNALVYDYRICHRGTSNLSKNTRPMLYMIFARPWFQEHLNFGSEHLF